MVERPVEISVSHLVRTFGDFTAVANTSFTVQRGEVFGLLGPNGAGKTTTFRMLCGLLPVTSGDLRVAGVDVVKSRTAARSNFGYVAQKFSCTAICPLWRIWNFLLVCMVCTVKKRMIE